MASKSKCPVCGSELTEDAESCTTCGTAFSDDDHTCPLCGGELGEDDEKCPSCGAEFDSTDWEGPPPAQPEAEELADEGITGEEAPEEPVAAEKEVEQAEIPEEEPEPDEEESDEEVDEPMSFEKDLEESGDATAQKDEPPEVEEESEEPAETPEPAQAEEEPESEVAEEPVEPEKPPEPAEEEPEQSDEVAEEPPPVAEIDDDLDEPPPVADVDDAPPDDLPPMDDEALDIPEEKPKEGLVDEELEDLVKLNGIGPLKAKILFDAGYTDLRKLKAATVVELMKVRGIGRKSAGEIKATLREIDLADIKHQELKIEHVETEYQCPLCGTVVSAFESSCYECGTVFDTDREEEDEEDADRLALSYYDSKLLRTPDNPELWYARGSTLVKMENFDMALKSFDRALEVDPGFQTAWISKAEVYNKLGNPIKAAECYGHVISKVGAAKPGDKDVAGGLEVPDMQVTAEDVKDFEAELDIEEPPAEPEDTEPKPTDEEMDKELGLDDVGDKPEAPAEEAGEVAEPEVPADEAEEAPTEEPVEVEPPPEEMPAEDPAQPEVAPEEKAGPPKDYEPEVAPAETLTEEEPQPPSEEATQGPEVPEAEVEVEGQAEGDLKPEDIRTTVVEAPLDMPVKMDFTKLPMDDELKGMSEKEQKKLLSKQAAHIKPLLLLAKEADVDVGPAKRLIAKGVAESKGGDMIEAIKYMGQGVEIIESRFKVKLSEDLNVLADLIRDLKVSGLNVTKAVDMMASAKDRVEERKFKDALEQMNELLELVEKARS